MADTKASEPVMSRSPSPPSSPEKATEATEAEISHSPPAVGTVTEPTQLGIGTSLLPPLSRPETREDAIPTVRKLLLHIKDNDLSPLDVVHELKDSLDITNPIYFFVREWFNDHASKARIQQNPDLYYDEVIESVRRAFSSKQYGYKGEELNSMVSSVYHLICSLDLEKPFQSYDFTSLKNIGIEKDRVYNILVPFLEGSMAIDEAVATLVQWMEEIYIFA